MAKRLVVTFPDIGEGVVEGEVIQWLKNEGEMLKQDEAVVVVMTDKATVELPAPSPGKLVKQYFQHGQMAIKDKPLYEIEIEGEDIQQSASSKKAPVTSHKEEEKAFIPSAKYDRTDGGEAIAIPKVRHLAKELGIDLNQVEGSGKSGRIEMADLRRMGNTIVRKEEHNDILHLSDDEEVPLIGIKSLMAKKMAESKAHIPHFSYFEKADVTRLVQLKKNVKHQAEEEGVRVTFMPFLIKALSLTINAYPILNSSYDEKSNQVCIHHQHNIGIAVTTSLGLIVPVLKGVQKMEIAGLIQAYDDLIERSHHSKLNKSDMHEATLTISNFGTSGHGIWATPIINYPEAAILAVAKIQPQPIIKNDAYAVADIIHLSWSFDHRIIDGDTAVHISDHFCQLLQNPASLI